MVDLERDTTTNLMDGFGECRQTGDHLVAVRA
jgi:hypothetical protein